MFDTPASTFDGGNWAYVILGDVSPWMHIRQPSTCGPSNPVATATWADRVYLSSGAPWWGGGPVAPTHGRARWKPSPLGGCVVSWWDVRPPDPCIENEPGWGIGEDWFGLEGGDTPAFPYGAAASCGAEFYSSEWERSSDEGRRSGLVGVRLEHSTNARMQGQIEAFPNVVQMAALKAALKIAASPRHAYVTDYAGTWRRVSVGGIKFEHVDSDATITRVTMDVVELVAEALPLVGPMPYGGAPP